MHWPLCGPDVYLDPYPASVTCTTRVVQEEWQAFRLALSAAVGRAVITTVNFPARVVKVNF